MKKIFGLALLGFCFLGCNNNADKGRFTVQAEIKNAPDQKIYLEQVFFSKKDPEVLDTGELKNGKFAVNASANEEGLYRLRFEKQETGYIFINDAPEIKFKADAKDMSLTGPDFNTPANRMFKNFLVNVNDRQVRLHALSLEIDSLQKNKPGDSLLNVKISAANTEALDFKHFILKSIDTLSDPVVAMFALGYTNGIDPVELKTLVPGLAKRFPEHRGIAGVIALYNEMMAAKAAPQQATAANAGTNGKLSIGALAPEITMADTSGKLFSLSALRGKYVLVDFWASWCAPCRGENPNVVANYNKYKNKNFTILGVSLDDDKAQWIKAINKDKLSWKEVSDLKGWSSAAVDKYGFEGIPYNVLLDPQGKIIAMELREADLGKKLEEVLGK